MARLHTHLCEQGVNQPGSVRLWCCHPLEALGRHRTQQAVVKYPSSMEDAAARDAFCMRSEKRTHLLLA